jgi:hypothetical protein
MNHPLRIRALSAFGLRPSFGLRGSAFGRRLPFLLGFVLLAIAAQPAPILACTACAGQSDSPMAQGMNWGIFSLLAVVGVVLGGVATFFIYLARRAAAVSAQAAEPLLPPLDPLST